MRVLMVSKLANNVSTTLSTTLRRGDHDFNEVLSIRLTSANLIMSHLHTYVQRQPEQFLAFSRSTGVSLKHRNEPLSNLHLEDEVQPNISTLNHGATDRFQYLPAHQQLEYVLNFHFPCVCVFAFRSDAKLNRNCARSR
jgi:hypothetical protein